jgi:hypothetical protein
MTIVSDEKLVAIIQDQIGLKLSALASQNDMTVDKLSALRQELEIRDDQIRALLENQQELTRTIQKLQGQIFELARLALQQPPRMEEKPAEAPLSPPPPPGKWQSGILGWLRALRGREGDR